MTHAMYCDLRKRKLVDYIAIFLIIVALCNPPCVEKNSVKLIFKDFVFNKESSNDLTIFKKNADLIVRSHEVQCYGVVYDAERDPPGQRSIYISPENTSEESYRLGTFLQFPMSSPVNPRLLAAMGFFYLGEKDKVRCFQFHSCVEGWTREDYVTSSRWHKKDCSFIHELYIKSLDLTQILRSRSGKSNYKNHSSNFSRPCGPEATTSFFIHSPRYLKNSTNSTASTSEKQFFLPPCCQTHQRDGKSTHKNLTSTSLKPIVLRAPTLVFTAPSTNITTSTSGFQIQAKQVFTKITDSKLKSCVVNVGGVININEKENCSYNCDRNTNCRKCWFSKNSSSFDDQKDL